MNKEREHTRGVRQRLRALLQLKEQGIKARTYIRRYPREIVIKVRKGEILSCPRTFEGLPVTVVREEKR